MTTRLRVITVIGFLVACSLPISVEGDEGYRKPPEIIAKMLEAPPPPSVSVNEAGDWMLLVEREGMPRLEEMAREKWRLGGRRFDPSTNGSHGPRAFVGIVVVDLKSGTRTKLSLPQDAGIGMPSWSRDGRRFAFTVTHRDGIELWVGDVATRGAKPVTSRELNGAAGAYQWLGNDELLCRFIPADRAPRPKPPAVPEGPVIQETAGRVAPVRTYQDLLKNPYDEARFDWIMRSQLAVVDVATGKRRDISGPAIYSSISVSPDESTWRVTRITKPYSYLVTYRSFPRIVELWKPDGTKLSELAVLPLADDVPIGGVPTGPRGHSWQTTSDTDMYWVEALDDGNPKNEVPHRDRVVARTKTGDTEIMKLEYRFSGVSWLEGSSRAVVREYDRKQRRSRTWLVDFANAAAEPRLIWDRNRQDRYNDPGRPVTHRDERGRSVITVENGAIYLTGSGSSPEGDRPFLDRMNLESLQTERLWRCSNDSYESVVRVLSRDGKKLVTRYETQTEPPNYYLRDLADGSRKAITEFQDPQKELRGLKKQLVTYERKDGVKLSATLYLPPGHQEGEKLPLIVWAYPREFTDPKVASQVSGSQHRFTRLRGTSHLFMLTQGYAIMDGAAMPVVGVEETANDTFVEQVVSSAEAAIEKAVAMGVADGDRVGVGGHSYGAFMTANLLAHSDIFKAGIARSGAYNRTLTPFGFQNERRTFWEAPDIYFSMSPFMHAPKINEPILMIHGEQDNNSGTFPIQSERLYHAVKGHGGSARLVMLPYESHGYRAKESVLHVLSEMLDWFDTHVKGKPSP